jgi:hypothetical protein
MTDELKRELGILPDEPVEPEPVLDLPPPPAAKKKGLLSRLFGL